MDDIKMIAEFMELEATPKYNPKEYYVKEYNSGEWYLPEEMKYHTSWDWLMPVVEECLCKLNMNDRHYHAIHDALWSINIEETYQAIVEFIKFYNETKNI